MQPCADISAVLGLWHCPLRHASVRTTRSPTSPGSTIGIPTCTARSSNPATDPDRSALLDAAFNEPVLNGLVETARRENPTLRIAGLRILESRALLGIAGSNRYPQLNQVTGAAAHVEQHEGGATGLSFESYQAGFDMGWELDFWGRFRRGIESAQRRLLRVHHQSARRAGAAERAGGGPVLRLPDDPASHRHRRAQCGHPETQPRDHREDIQGGPGLGTGRAAGQDPVPRARWRQSRTVRRRW